MFNFLKNKQSKVKRVAKKELKKNLSVIKSLRDYDEGKKDISTTDIARRFGSIRTSY